MTSVNASLPAAPSSYSGTTSYQYDGKTELTQKASTRSGGYTNADSYDLAENPTQFRSVTQPTANADNQLPVSGVTYDGNGNPSKVEGLTASFDLENRATSLGSVSNTWGANGLRASKGSTYFLYDGSLPVCELSSTGSVTATNTFGGAGLISRRSGSSSTFYTFDAQGSVTQRYTSTGSLVSSDLYDGFGKGTSTGSGDVFGYEGQAGYYTDTSTGLILCGHRFYDSAAGRFINRDPIGYAGGINLYGYTKNNPTKFVDPNGHDPADNLKTILNVTSAVLYLFNTAGSIATAFRHQPSPPGTVQSAAPPEDKTIFTNEQEGQDASDMPDSAVPRPLNTDAAADDIENAIRGGAGDGVGGVEAATVPEAAAPVVGGSLAIPAIAIGVTVYAGADLVNYSITGQSNGLFTGIGVGIGNELFPPGDEPDDPCPCDDPGPSVPVMM